MIRPVFAIFAAALLTGIFGCASGSLSRIESEVDLPQDLQDKFEIKEAEPAAVPSAQPVSVTSAPVAPKPVAKKVRGKKGAAPFAFPNRRPLKDPIWPGEKQVYEITYFGMPAGDFTFDVLPHKSINGRRVYHVRGNALSSKVFSLFYRLNDTIETFVDYEGLFSHRFHLQLDETKQTRDSLELFDSEKKETFYWNRWNHKTKGYSEKKEYAPMKPFSQDSFSALLYLRTLPLKPGSVYTFPVVSEGKSWEAVVHVVRRETMETPIGKLETVVLKPETKYQGVLQKRGDSFIWLTDDDRRILVRLEAKVKIGTVIAAIKKAEPGVSPEAEGSAEKTAEAADGEP
jgi:hypothetical protein